MVNKDLFSANINNDNMPVDSLDLYRIYDARLLNISEDDIERLHF